MSGAINFTPTNTMAPQGSLTNGNLLQGNTTLLQPLSGYFRLFDALSLLDQSAATTLNQLHIVELQTQTLTLQTQTLALQTSTATLQTTTVDLQNQINAINAQIASINSQIGGINSHLSSLDSAINTINGRLSAAGIP